VAVTVQEQAPFVVLETGDYIVGVGPGAESHFRPLLGLLLWDSFPGSAPLFKPYYDNARRTREPVQFVQFYDGYITRVRAVPRAEGRLDLYWEPISRLDTLTLAGLVETLEESLELLDEHRADLNRDEVRKALRVSEQPGPPAPASLQALP
jgi:hypothetical protein